ncbi:MAG: T9SS type A sorting domain-containing protein, partial [Bacteroidota bacterium]
SDTSWSFVDSVSQNAVAGDVTFVNVLDTTTNDSISVMRVTAPMGNAGNMSAVVSSSRIDSIASGDYQMKMRFRNGAGGDPTAAGPLEVRCFVQDYETWTNFSPSAIDAGQLLGIFKLGGISASWPNASISDTDADNNYSTTGEWTEVTLDLNIPDTVDRTDIALKFMVRIGSAHSAIEDVNFEFDYFEWTFEVEGDSIPMDTTINAPIDTTVLGSYGINWQFDTAQGWNFVDTVGTNAVAEDITFVTVDDTATVMRVTASMGLAGDMTALISSDNLDTLPSGDYNIKMRFRQAIGGSEANAGPLEVRCFIQDYDTWTNFSPSAEDAGQVLGIFKLGGISASWPGGTISDTDTADSFADTGEWVELATGFNVTDTLYDKAFKFLVRIGSAHTAIEDVNFEFDYIDWNAGALPVDTTGNDTTVNILSLVEANSIALYPNPAQDRVTLKFELLHSSEVSFSLFTLEGKEVKQVSPQQFSSGAHKADLNVSALSNGLYMYRLKVNGEHMAGKLSIFRP